MNMGEQDITEKILESYNDVFADIVNVFLFNGEQIIRPDELVDQAPRSAYKADGQLREIERDVAKRWIKSNIRIACIGFENQTNPDASMPLRVFGYDGADKEEVRNMCDVLDRVEKRGIAQGIAQVIEQGIERGITKGADEQARKTAMNLQKMGLSPADITRAVDRSLSIVQKWLGAGIA